MSRHGAWLREPSKYSAAKFRPPHHRRTPSATNILRWLRRLVRLLNGTCNIGPYNATCTPAALSWCRLTPPPIMRPAPSISSRIPVSYTHLRAHETRHDLVCRL